MSTDDESSQEENLKQPNDHELIPIHVQTQLNGCGSESKTRQHKPHKFALQQERTCQSLSIFCLAVAICLLTFVIVILIRTNLSDAPGSKQFTLPVVEQSWKANKKLITTAMVLNPEKQTDNWEVRLPQQSTEANVRLVDVDGDGLLDIIVATTLVFENSTVKIKGKQVPKEYIKNDCHNEDWLGTEHPCMNLLIAYRGYDGKQLWVTPCKSKMFVTNCEEFDVNKDGKKDCIGAGRHASLTAFDPYKGAILWEREIGEFLRTDWNTYQPRALPDWDEDGVPEILVVNGGAPIIPANVHNRTAGRLIVFSGATGRRLGQRYLEIPHSKESYMSPVIYKSRTGSSFILFGSGGETVPGDLLGISVPDFCNYIMGFKASVCPQSDEDFIWKTKVRDKYGIFILFSDPRKGVMVPPVIVDVNRDGIDDIVVSSYGGFVMLLDGVNLTTMWTTEFNDMESYSTPAPGFFDDDDYIDFMMHHNVGAWPYYTYSYTTILSGKDGSKLWSLRSNMFETTSDFTIRTKQDYRDIFVFRIKGRDSSIMFNADGEIIWREDISQTRETRKKRHTQDNKEHAITLPTKLTRKEKLKTLKAKYEKKIVNCEMDLTGISPEVFMIDRTALHFGIRIKVDVFEKVRYNTTNEEERCMVLQTNEFWTGAIADVDGDGTLDYLSIVPLEGIKFSSDYVDTSTEYVTKISKVNIFPNFSIMDKIHLNAATSVTSNNEEKGIEEIEVLLPDQQQWTQYLGYKSDSHYYND
ncbi:hypothetical protein CHS0354_011095 [Potamilus streckersoni]|uniref:FAM234A/B beta-propeller domain-containing protein n=1 Tax=Potamilus streckersoni TaxID=2493646 RepID=A0AAE0WBQ1_9BIVA|nr:hypothetical protein CHS0354_011095 [Potamilus streckersoni]